VRRRTPRADRLGPRPATDGRRLDVKSIRVACSGEEVLLVTTGGAGGGGRELSALFDDGSRSGGRRGRRRGLAMAGGGVVFDIGVPGRRASMGGGSRLLARGRGELGLLDDRRLRTTRRGLLIPLAAGGSVRGVFVASLISVSTRIVLVSRYRGRARRRSWRRGSRVGDDNRELSFHGIL
jgi:hypothetical protein